VPSVIYDDARALWTSSSEAGATVWRDAAPAEHPNPNTLCLREAIKCAPAHITGDLLRAGAGASFWNRQWSAGLRAARTAPPGNEWSTCIASTGSQEPVAEEARGSVCAGTVLSARFRDQSFWPREEAELSARFLGGGTGTRGSELAASKDTGWISAIVGPMIDRWNETELGQ